MSTAVIDFQGYLSSQNSFIIKELSIIDVDHPTQLRQWLFKPPTQFNGNPNSLANKWIYKNLHGISWEAGTVDYSELENVLQSATSSYVYLFAKGLEKCKFLEQLTGKDVFNLQDFGCPSLKCLPALEFTKCDYHRGVNYSCSLKFAKKLSLWICHNRSNVDFNNAKVREKTYNQYHGIINPEFLAFNGFIHSRNHTIKCIYCNAEFDDSIVECPCNLHKLYNSNCRWFVKQGLFQ